MRAAIVSEAPPRYERKPSGSRSMRLRTRSGRSWRWPMLATVIAERVGWTRGITVFKERVGRVDDEGTLSAEVIGGVEPKHDRMMPHLQGRGDLAAEASSRLVSR